MKDIVLTKYDYDKKERIETGNVGIYTLAGSMNSENMADVLDEYLNLGGKQFPEGKDVGLKLRNTHRTIQRSIVCFCLGVICGLSDQEYTDARNETAIQTAKKIKTMVDSGELSTGFYI